jgi:hypothetical protein
MHSNPYVSYYLAQQQGHGMPVFRGSLWQMGHGQMGYGLGNLFRSIAKVAMPMLKRGGKALGKIVATTGADLLGDIASGKNVKEAAKARGLQALSTAKAKAMEQMQANKQTGSGTRRKRTRSKSTKRPSAKGSKSTVKRSRSETRTVKKRKPSTSRARSKQTKKRKTSPQDIFG